MASDLPWEDNHLGPGSRIGKYVLEEQVGHGRRRPRQLWTTRTSSRSSRPVNLPACYQGIRVRAIDRTFIVRPGQLSYAIEFYGPVRQWPAVYASLWHPLVTSFQSAY